MKRKGKAKENLNVEKGVPKANILIIDDDESIRKVLTEILTGEGYSVESAATGMEAAEMARLNVNALMLKY